VADYASKIQEFNRRISDIAAKLTGLADRRKSYSLAAAEGDTRALKQIGDVDFEEGALIREQKTLSSAIETAQALEKQHALEAQAAEEHARQVEAYSAARGIITIHEEIDLALIHLREMFERRSVILKSLGNIGVVDPSLLMRLSNKSGPTSAAHAAGLNKYLNMDMVPNVSQRPLSDVNPVLLNVGAPATNGKSNGRGSTNGGSRR
jgi:hypothetical protein